METQDIISKLKNIKTQYQNEGFNLLALFGSYAQNTNTDESDIDILYDVDEKFLNKYRGFRSASKVLEIQQELSNIFDKKVDLTSPTGLNENLRKEILAKAIYV